MHDMYVHQMDSISHIFQTIKAGGVGFGIKMLQEGWIMIENTNRNNGDYYVGVDN